MRKNTLLIAVAAAALAVGSGTAFSQGAPQGGQKSDSPAVQSNPASKNAPAEKIQGQGAGGQKMGQEQKSQDRKSTTGQAPSEPKAGQAKPSEPKAGQANERRDNNKMGQEQKSQDRKGTTGQAPSQTQPSQQQTTPKGDRANEPNRAGGQMNQRGGANERGGATVNERGGANVNVNLTTEQRTKIHSIIVADRSAPRIARADFDVRVGTVVPRGKVKLVAVPSTIVEIQPAWRGFEYFLVGDEIVIVDPATLRIVAVIPA